MKYQKGHASGADLGISRRGGADFQKKFGRPFFYIDQIDFLSSPKPLKTIYIYIYIYIYIFFIYFCVAGKILKNRPKIAF